MAVLASSDIPAGLMLMRGMVLAVVAGTAVAVGWYLGGVAGLAVVVPVCGFRRSTETEKLGGPSEVPYLTYRGLRREAAAAYPQHT